MNTTHLSLCRQRGKSPHVSRAISHPWLLILAFLCLLGIPGARAQTYGPPIILYQNNLFAFAYTDADRNREVYYGSNANWAMIEVNCSPGEPNGG